MNRLLICVKDRPTANHRRQGIQSLPIKAGGVYTQVYTYQHCDKGLVFVKLAECDHPIISGNYVCRCMCRISPNGRIRGTFDMRRFRPFQPPENLTSTDEVNRLYRPSWGVEMFSKRKEKVE